MALAAYVPNTYVGNGVAVTYPYTFRVFATAEVVVSVAGVTKAHGVDYTLTGVGADTGGTVVFTAAPAYGAAILIQADIDETQTANLSNEQAFFQERIETALDRSVRMVQLVGRGALRIPTSEVATVGLTTLPSARANTWLGFDANKNPVAMVGGPAVIDNAIFNVDAFGAVGDGVTDDTAAVQAAIAAAHEGATVAFTGSKHYYLRSLGAITKSLTIDGGGCRITCDVTPSGTSGTPLFLFSGSFGTYFGSGSVTAGAHTLVLSTPADYANFAVGDYVTIACDNTQDKWDLSGVAFTGFYELHRVANVAVDGTVTLAEPFDNSMTINVRIRKVSMVTAPVVRNFGRITEVDPGGSAPSSSMDADPSIVVFWGCDSPRAENINVDGWNLVVAGCGYCYAPVIDAVRGANAFRPTTGGHGVVAKFTTVRAALATHCRAFNARHVVDWNYSVDSQSQYCEAEQTDVSNNIFGYLTHGLASYRIRSIYDSAINGNGWAVGNTSFAGDYDVDIVGFTWFSSSALSGQGIVVWCKSDGVRVDRCRLVGVAPIQYNRGAKNLEVLNTYAESTQSGGRAISVYQHSILHPDNLTVRGCVCLATGLDSYGIYADATGNITVEQNRFKARRPARFITDTNCDDLTFYNNDLETEGSSDTALWIGDTDDVYSPQGFYEVSRNRHTGGASGQGYYIIGKLNLRLIGNRSDATVPYVIRFIGVQSIVGAGGLVWDNESVNDWKQPGAQFVGTADATVANTVTETSLAPTGVGTLVFPANFWKPGKVVRVHMSGIMQCTATPTLRFRALIGGTTLVDTVSNTLFGPLTNSMWEANIDITCRTVGVSGTLNATAVFRYCNGRAAQNHGGNNTATINTTASGTLFLNLTWGTASASNTITCSHCIVSVVNPGVTSL